LFGPAGLREAGGDETEEAEQLLRRASDGSDMVVTPREVDELVLSIASLLADGLNQALHPAIDTNTLHHYLHL